MSSIYYKKYLIFINFIILINFIYKYFRNKIVCLSNYNDSHGLVKFFKYFNFQTINLLKNDI